MIQHIAKFEVYTDGLCFSRHATRGEAHASVISAQQETQREIERLLDEVAAGEAFINSFIIKEN